MSNYKTEEEAVEAAKERALHEGYYDFDGQNCDWDEEYGECIGWDGLSRRCACGNRRVYWEPYQQDDGTWNVLAVAY